jgi:hypothetical protein
LCRLKAMQINKLFKAASPALNCMRCCSLYGAGDMLKTYTGFVHPLWRGLKIFFL